MESFESSGSRDGAADMNGSRRDVVGRMARHLEKAGSGISDQEIARQAVEAERESFSAEEKAGFMSIREGDLQNIWEDYPQGADKNGSVESPSGIRIEWDTSGIRIVSDHEGESETPTRLGIAGHVGMNELIDLYRAAEDALMEGLRKAGGERDMETGN